MSPHHEWVREEYELIREFTVNRTISYREIAQRMNEISQRRGRSYRIYTGPLVREAWCRLLRGDPYIPTNLWIWTEEEISRIRSLLHEDCAGGCSKDRNSWNEIATAMNNDPPPLNKFYTGPSIYNTYWAHIYHRYAPSGAVAIAPAPIREEDHNNAALAIAPAPIREEDPNNTAIAIAPAPIREEDPNNTVVAIAPTPIREEDLNNTAVLDPNPGETQPQGEQRVRLPSFAEVIAYCDPGLSLREEQRNKSR